MLSQPTATSEPRGQLRSVEEIADLLGCSPKSVRRYIAEGRLPASRLGGRLIRVRESDALALLSPIPTVEAS